jgi:carbamoyltransferase
MNILGFNSGWHDSAAVLLVNGQIERFIETDRISRIKQGMHQSPSLAIVELLKQTESSLSDIDRIAVGWDEIQLAKVSGIAWN